MDCRTKFVFFKVLRFGNLMSFLFFFLSPFALVLQAQYAQDALRFSMYNLQGSSRFVGMGGAMGAVGADFTTASYNPAGIGFFQRQALSLSPGLNWASTESNWLTRQSDTKSLFQFGSAGLVLTRRSNHFSERRTSHSWIGLLLCCNIQWLFAQ